PLRKIGSTETCPPLQAGFPFPPTSYQLGTRKAILTSVDERLFTISGRVAVDEDDHLSCATTKIRFLIVVLLLEHFVPDVGKAFSVIISGVTEDVSIFVEDVLVKAFVYSFTSWLSLFQPQCMRRRWEGQLQFQNWDALNQRLNIEIIGWVKELTEDGPMLWKMCWLKRLFYRLLADYHFQLQGMRSRCEEELTIQELGCVETEIKYRDYWMVKERAVNRLKAE
ncbi:3405_t:CDS:2, partial [Paraglomus occultum]